MCLKAVSETNPDSLGMGACGSQEAIPVFPSLISPSLELAGTWMDGTCVAVRSTMDVISVIILPHGDDLMFNLRIGRSSGVWKAVIPARRALCWAICLFNDY